ncbi:MAG: 50S ribosomal protein L5 [bacterium]
MNLQEKYKKEVVPQMKKKFGHKSIMSVPKIVKVVVNTSFGRLVSGKTGDDLKKTTEAIVADLAIITGQRPTITRAKKSIATFKLREGMPTGAATTLRKNKMEDFINRFINVVLPRSRDFRGIDPKTFDKRGNLTIGIKEQIIFPEIYSEKIRNIFGLEVTITTSAKTKEEGIELLKLMGFPLRP